jgi:hypothetical protein
MIPNITKFKNPLDDVFDVDRDSDNELTEYEQITSGELANLAAPTAPVEKDQDDVENDARIEEVYNVALETFQNQMAYTEIIEPRYAARNAEVAASYLNIALQAASTKAKVKSDRKRAAAFIPGMGAKVTNNTIVATREEILRMISIDCETKPI